MGTLHNCNVCAFDETNPHCQECLERELSEVLVNEAPTVELECRECGSLMIYEDEYGEEMVCHHCGLIHFLDLDTLDIVRTER